MLKRTTEPQIASPSRISLLVRWKVGKGRIAGTPRVVILDCNLSDVSDEDDDLLKYHELHEYLNCVGRRFETMINFSDFLSIRAESIVRAVDYNQNL